MYPPILCRPVFPISFTRLMIKKLTTATHPVLIIHPPKQPYKSFCSAQESARYQRQCNLIDKKHESPGDLMNREVKSVHTNHQIVNAARVTSGQWKHVIGIRQLCQNSMGKRKKG